MYLQVQIKQKRVVGAQNEVEEIEDRLHAMSEHLKNVRQELTHTQGLTNARKKEIETENHLLQIAEREEGRLKQEVRKLEKELEDLKEKKNMFEVCKLHVTIIPVLKAK